jgi:hypothetical protein
MAERAGLPLVGDAADLITQRLKVLNSIQLISQQEQQDQTPIQNHPMMENQNTSGTPKGLPLVGIGSSQIQRKDRRRTASHPTRFQDHLVLESKSISGSSFDWKMLRSSSILVNSS